MTTVSFQNFSQGKPVESIDMKAGVAPPTTPEKKPGLIEALAKTPGELWKAYTGALNKTNQEVTQSLQSTAQNVSENVKKAFGKSELPASTDKVGTFEKDLSNRLFALGHVAGDVALQTFQPLLSFAKNLVPTELRNDSAKAVDYVANKINEIPGMTAGLNLVNEGWDNLSEDTKQSLAKDLPNLIALYGGSGTSLNPEIPSISSVTKGLAGDVKAGLNAARTGIAETSAKITEGVKELKPNIKPLQEKYVNDLADSYREAAGGTKKTTKILDKSAKMGKDPAQYLAERNIVPEVEQGKIRTGTQADTLHKSVDPLNEHLNLALKEVQPGVEKININDVRRRALANAERLPNISETAREQIKNGINKEFDLQIEKHGSKATLQELNDIKKSNWADTKFDSTNPYKNDIHYNVGKAAKDTIETSVPKSAFSVKELNQAIGDAYDAERFLRSLEGNAVKGGRLGRYAARIVGATVGSTIPVPGGSILGAFGGDAVAEILQGQTFSNPLKQLILRNLEVADPQAYQQALKFINDSKLAREARLRLPEGAVAGTEKNPIVTPEYKGGQGVRRSAESLNKAPNLEGGYINPAAMLEDAKKFLKNSPPYALLQDMSRYTNDFYAKKLDPTFEANLRDVISKYDPKMSGLPSGQLSEQFGAILDEAKFKETLPAGIGSKIAQTAESAKSLVETPEKITLYRGQSPSEAGHGYFTSDPEFGKDFGGPKSKVISGSLPKGSKVIDLTDTTTVRSNPDALIGENIIKSTNSLPEFYDHFWKNNYAAVVDIGNRGEIEVVVNPKFLKYFK